jgi:hypothetical protein
MSGINIAKVIDALNRRAIGCVVETTEVVAEGAKRRAKRITRQIPPDTRALIYILNNRVPDQWSAKPTPPVRQVIARMRFVRRKKPPCRS